MTWATADEWRREGPQIMRATNRVTWRLIRWVVAGADFDPNFNETHAITGFSRSHLWNLYRVGLAFPEADESGPAFSVCKEILRDPDAERRRDLYDLAKASGWRQQDVVAHIDAHPPPGRSPEEAAAVEARHRRAGYVPAAVRCPSCATVFRVQGHKVTRAEAQAAIGGDDDRDEEQRCPPELPERADPADAAGGGGARRDVE